MQRLSPAAWSWVCGGVALALVLLVAAGRSGATAAASGGIVRLPPGVWINGVHHRYAPGSPTGLRPGFSEQDLAAYVGTHPTVDGSGSPVKIELLTGSQSRAEYGHSFGRSATDRLYVVTVHGHFVTEPAPHVAGPIPAGYRSTTAQEFFDPSTGNFQGMIVDR